MGFSLHPQNEASPQEGQQAVEGWTEKVVAAYVWSPTTRRVLEVAGPVPTSTCPAIYQIIYLCSAGQK